MVSPTVTATTFGYAIPSELYKEEKVVKLLDTKGLYRQFRKYKQVTRDKNDIIFELDDDEAALISCVFQRGHFFVWSPTILHSKDLIGGNKITFAYLCVLRDGLWMYPSKDLRNILLQEGDKIFVLDTWKDDQQQSRESLREMIELYKIGKF